MLKAVRTVADSLYMLVGWFRVSRKAERARWNLHAHE